MIGPMLLLAQAIAGQTDGMPASTRTVQSAAVFATIDRSEWCPAGTVHLDLRTGRYSLVPQRPRLECERADLERPVTEGQLGSEPLRAIRAAHEDVQRQGLVGPACRNGARSGDIIISNAGPAILVITGPGDTLIAPDELRCWSAAGRNLHNLLEDVFGSGAR